MSAIDDLPPLREVIRQHALSARKSLGQNFLLDLNLTARIARAAGELDNATIVEIGPGPGGDPADASGEDYDPLAALFAEGPSKPPEDPALARLFPDPPIAVPWLRICEIAAACLAAAVITAALSAASALRERPTALIQS